MVFFDMQVQCDFGGVAIIALKVIAFEFFLKPSSSSGIFSFWKTHILQ
jgi:hypothetical protein